MEEPVISIKGLTYKIGDRYLLNDINWNINPGERWVVFGMNGSGKTTLLSTIAGFNRYSSGEIKVFGNDLQGNQLINIRKRIGFVSNSFFDRYYSQEKAYDIVMSGLSGTLGVYKGINNDNLEKANIILNDMDMCEKAQQPFSELSKGERQKILIARALISSPDVLILDEPVTGLDVVAREQIMQLVSNLSNKNITLLYVTHYTEEILDVFDQCILLKKGQIYSLGRTKDLFTEEIISAFLERKVAFQRIENKRYIVL